jgi:hypothetical protein
MKAGFWDCVRHAFNARPIGMFVPPNWIGLGVFGLLGMLNPGFWVIGFGLELAYLGSLATNGRFQRLVRATQQSQTRRQWQATVDDQVKQLSAEGQRRYRSLESRCRSILEQQQRGLTGPVVLDAQGEGLGRLLWVYLRLMLTRQAIDKIIQEAAGGTEDINRLGERIQNLQIRLKEESIGEELRKSLTAQIEILQQRVEKRREAREKLAFLDAELVRIEEQAELVREQAVLSTDSQSVSQRIDQITATLGGTSQWISEQQKIYGAVEDLMAEPPALSANIAPRQSQ